MKPPQGAPSRASSELYGNPQLSQAALTAVAPRLSYPNDDCVDKLFNSHPCVQNLSTLEHGSGLRKRVSLSKLPPSRKSSSSLSLTQERFLGIRLPATRPSVDSVEESACFLPPKESRGRKKKGAARARLMPLPPVEALGVGLPQEASIAALTKGEWAATGFHGEIGEFDARLLGLSALVPSKDALEDPLFEKSFQCTRGVSEGSTRMSSGESCTYNTGECCTGALRISLSSVRRKLGIPNEKTGLEQRLQDGKDACSVAGCGDAKSRSTKRDEAAATGRKRESRSSSAEGVLEESGFFPAEPSEQLSAGVGFSWTPATASHGFSLDAQASGLNGCEARRPSSEAQEILPKESASQQQSFLPAPNVETSAHLPTPEEVLCCASLRPVPALEQSCQDANSAASANEIARWCAALFSSDDGLHFPDTSDCSHSSKKRKGPNERPAPSTACEETSTQGVFWQGAESAVGFFHDKSFAELLKDKAESPTDAAEEELWRKCVFPFSLPFQG